MGPSAGNNYDLNFVIPIGNKGTIFCLVIERPIDPGHDVFFLYYQTKWNYTRNLNSCSKYQENIFETVLKRSEDFKYFTWNWLVSFELITDYAHNYY